MLAPQDPSQCPGCCRAYDIYSTSLGKCQVALVFCLIYIYYIYILYIYIIYIYIIYILYIYMCVFYLFVGCCSCFARWDVTCLRSNASLRIRDPQLNFQFVSNDSHRSPRQQKRKKMREHVLHWAGGRVRSGLFFYMFWSPSLTLRTGRLKFWSIWDDWLVALLIFNCRLVGGLEH